MSTEDIFKLILDSAFEVHKNLGPGLLESVYSKCLVLELKSRGLMVETEKVLPIHYKELVIDSGFRVDILVENKVIIELKSVDALKDIHTSQLLTYLKLSNIELGLLVNFNTIKLKNGIKRIVKNYNEVTTEI